MKVFQPIPAGAVKGPNVLVAGEVAWKSVTCKADVPKVPLRISTSNPWNILKVALPVTDCCLILSVTEVMTAVSGDPDVLKDRILRYCFFNLSSPKRRVVDVALKLPPVFEV